VGGGDVLQQKKSACHHLTAAKNNHTQTITMEARSESLPQNANNKKGEMKGGAPVEFVTTVLFGLHTHAQRHRREVKKSVKQRIQRNRTKIKLLLTSLDFLFLEDVCEEFNSSVQILP
jgi:hypothetical protein